MTESASSSSPYWYRVANLKPALRRHVHIQRQQFRGKRWYVLQDPSTGRFHRFSPEAYRLIGLMDGSHTMQAIWEQACEHQTDTPPEQDELIQLLTQLHQFDVLRSDVPADIAEMLERSQRQQSQQRRARWRSPLAIRFPLFDPERFLNATFPFIQPILNKTFLFIWLLLVSTALLMATVHWSELTENLSDRVLATENLLLLWFIYPVIKAMHELGHAYLIKRWGGEVHEMGIMLLVLMPVPYVDASSSSAFGDKYSRMLVGAGGMIVELSLAALAMLLWLNVEPGIVRSMAFNVMLIAGVSTVFLNGNPLLRFDGYYILSDWLEIPNLAGRSNRYWSYLGQRYFLKMKQAVAPQGSRIESRWLMIYSPLAFIYRIFISLTIALFVSTQLFVVGIILAIWALLGSLIMPVVKLVWSLLHHPVRRERGIALVLGTTTALLLFLFSVPFPSSTVVEGVIWVPEESRVISQVEGFVDEIQISSGKPVNKGQVLFKLSSLELETDVKVLAARLKEYQARYQAGIRDDRAQALVLKDEIAQLDAELAEARKKQEQLVIKSPQDGVLQIPGGDELEQQYLRRGQVIAYVVNNDETRVRVVVSQDNIDKVRQSTESVTARFIDQPEQNLKAILQRQVPAASHTLPSAALSIDGGGQYALDPTAMSGKDTNTGDQPLQVLAKLFQFDIQIQTSAGMDIGKRVYVRFKHPSEAIAPRVIRALRRLFLRQFNV
ncbi:MAG: HlyD family efflux transporter periplasmic adaptor subunit [Gammaproteobacteria bacterium]|nr:HlyD family efflux transporter periplasmic adaptor subunit [Gammaproteobacteria bacterium]